MAPDVPTIKATLPLVLQPPPLLFAAPSPITAPNRASASMGQRSAKAVLRRGIFAPPISGRASREIPSLARSSESQSQRLWLNTPVAEAIDTLLAESPNRREHKYSAKPNH